MSQRELAITPSKPVVTSMLTPAPSGLLQRRASNAAPLNRVPSSVHDVLRSSGQPLDASTRSFMESRFGHDFSQVRVHTDDRAAQSAHTMNALAYTIGQKIVFANGQFAPNTTEGRKLLAHELAHVVQQSARTPWQATSVSSSNDPWEHAADQAGQQVANGHATSRDSLGMSSPIGLVQRHPDPRTTCPAPPAYQRIGAGGAAVWGPANRAIERAYRNSHTSNVILTGSDFARQGAQRLRLSRENLNRLDEETRAQANPLLDRLSGLSNQLQPDIMDFSEQVFYEIKTADYGGEGEEQLAGYYRLADAIRIEVGGPSWNQSLAGWYPDHALPFEGNPDRIVCTEQTNYNTLPRTGLILYEVFERVAGSAAGTTPAAPATQPYTIVVHGASATIQARPAPGDTDLSGAENATIVNLIPGLTLQRLHRTQNGVGEWIEATVNGNTLVGSAAAPITLQSPQTIRLAVNPETRQLRISQPARPRFGVNYPYLSPGHLTLNYDSDSGLSGTGDLTPNIPLLNQLTINVELAQGRLRAFIAVPPERLRGPFPGFSFTRAELGADILPAFRPSGVIEFAIGPRSRPVLTGVIEASADANGLVFDGTIDAHIPRVDQARGNVTYRNGQWSGSIVIATTQIRFPGVQSGTLRVDFTNRGADLSGNVELLIANQAVTLTARRHESQWIFGGRGTFNLPGLAPINAEVETDGENITASARTTMQIASLTGTLEVRYRNGRWSGQGQAQLNRGRAQGTVTVRLSEAGRISGDGSIQYRFTENLIGRVGVLLREDRTMRVSGELRFETIQLFREIADRRRLYRFPRISIPILGIALGPVDVGLVARIDSEIGVHYNIGPGVLRNTRISAAIDLLSDNPNLEFEAGTELNIPLGGGFYLTVEGSIALSAGIASVSGGVSVTGDAGLRGAFNAGATLQYRANQWRLHAMAELLVHPELILTIDARVRAEAGVGPFSVEAVRSWNLARFSWGSDLNFGLRFPFDYATGQEFRFPSFDQIEWVYPRDIDFNRMLRQLIH